MTDKRTRVRASLRTSLMGFGVAAVIYVAVLGLLFILAIQPSSARLRVSSQSVLAEYRESSLRASELDATRSQLWRLIGTARTAQLPLDTLEALRTGIERLAETSNATNRLASGSASGLRSVLAEAVVYEERLRNAALGVIAALELGDMEAAELLIRRTDSLDAPLSHSLSTATTMALQQVSAHEHDLGQTLGALKKVVWIWLIGGLLALSFLAVFLRKRLHVPLERLDVALDRIGSGDLGVYLEAEHGDELGRLMQQFNRMAAILKQRAVEDEQRAEDRSTRTRLILDAALDAVVVTDANGTVKEWSPQAERVFGWSRDEIFDRRVVDTVIPPEYRESHLASLERFARTGTDKFLNRRLERIALRKDGTRFPVEVTVTLLQTGSQTEFSTFVRDITDRKQAQAALLASEARYRAAFEQAGVGMVEVDLDGRYVRVNRAFAEFTGRPPEEIVGKTVSQLALPDDRVADEASFRRALTTGFMRRQKHYARPDGTVVVGTLTAVLVRDPSGAPRYVLTVVQDVTAQHRLEEELRQAHKMDAVGQLAGGIAHDFNNLLTAIIGYAELLRGSEKASAVVREDAAAIQATAARGAELARNLLALARTAPARDEAVDVHQAINEIRDIASRTFDRRLSMVVHLDARRPTVTGDRSLLTTAFLNLAVNARDAMPDGGQLIVTTAEKVIDQEECDRLAGVISPGPFIVIRFRDTGTGMPPSVQRRVFEPFFTNKPAGKGTGIGLSMVYGTVRSHSGAIEVDSTIGAGTVFTIYLPLRTEAALENGEIVQSIVTGSGRILLVDDDDAVRDVATRMLEQLGYEVECATNGAEGVDRVAVAPTRFDLVILDGNMPRLQGREAALLIREFAPDLPLILATGYLEPGDSERLTRFGFNAAIAKPYSMSDLSRVVANQLAAVK
ncbi:MAG TPA: PAS domain S-box protein [Gemmatimonadaceae bacterium]|nr:PAS domain S-box protein [Gemmatimonadaceae bacterium]